MLENYIKISFITVVRNREAYEGCLQSLAELYIPENVTVDVLSITDADNLAAGYNQGMKNSDAEYKVYLKDTMRITNSQFIADFLQIFKANEDVGAIGIEGIAKLRFYDEKSCLEPMTMKITEGKRYEKVACLQGGLFITARDYKWREDLFREDDFVYMSQSLEFRNRGFGCIAVPSESWCYDIENSSSDKGFAENEKAIFLKEYQEYVLPEREKDEKKIAFIIYEPDDEKYRQFLESFRGVEWPETYQSEIIRIKSNHNLASVYNEIIKNSDAKYKIYLYQAMAVLEKQFLVKIIKTFEEHEDIGIIGLLGCILPSSGKMCESRKIFGRYHFYNNEIKNYVYKNPLYYQEVNAIERSFMATQTDLFWDEEIDESLLGISACVRMKINGYGSVIVQQNQANICFSQENLFSLQSENENRKKSEKFLLNKYGRRIYPLVSILIPTYNQPIYFEKALLSALKQDYRNIEIIIGDDSTDEQTKKLMCKYLECYEHIRYFFHGPAGQNGRRNVKFLINHCAGEYINYLLHDDLFYLGKISKMMDCCLVDEDIHMVSSLRDLIDKDGKGRGILSPWLSFENEILTCREVGAKILERIENFWGELSTVLIKKNSLRHKNEYLIGLYCGIRDIAYGDISTWLEVGRKGGKCVYLAECLSAYRMHIGQNTRKGDVGLKCILDFYSFIVLSWLNDVYIHDYKKFVLLCDRWYKVFVREQMEWILAQEKNKVIKIPEFFLVLKIGKLVLKRQYEDALHEGIEYILSHTEYPEAIFAVCEKDEQGRWHKKDKVSASRKSS